MTVTRRTLKARYVFPIVGPPIRDGEVTIEHGRIASVGPGGVGGDVEDLGNTALLPGLVNAHAHLELGNLEHPLGEPGMGFVDWLREVIAHRTASPDASKAFSRQLAQSARLGVAAIGDIAQTSPSDELPAAQGVALTSFLELIAPTPDRIATQVERAERHLAASRGGASWHAGLSPHAPYSVHPELLSRAVTLSAEHHIPLAMHLAESREELELIERRSGPMRAMLDELGVWTPELCPAGITPADYVRQLALAHRALVIHGNYLDDAAIAVAAAESSRITVVYCPRTHAYFGHDAYPLEKLLAAGASVALGTDSAASSPDLSVLAEMREAARRHPSVPGATIVEMGTLQAARALERELLLGSLMPGRRANLVAVALPDRDAADPHELLLADDGPITGMWHPESPHPN